LDDLAFDMYQDPEVAHIIRLLDQKKQDMVRQEKYEQAKNLKQAIADLQKVLLLLGGRHMWLQHIDTKYLLTWWAVYSTNNRMYSVLMSY